MPGALRDLGLGGVITAAHCQIRVTAGLDCYPGSPGQAATLVHLDMPRWFHSPEPVPHLRSLAEAVRQHWHLEIRYRLPVGGDLRPRVVAPLGLVNKAGTWYLVAMTRSPRITVFRAGRITTARILAEPAARPPGFDLAEFWERWSQEFAASRPHLRVRLRASPPGARRVPRDLRRRGPASP